MTQNLMRFVRSVLWLRIWNIRKKTSLTYLNTINTYEVNQYMDIDVNTRRNLEITETMRDKVKRGSLLWVLDNTETSMGARLLKQWIEKPLINPIEINKRLYSVKELTENIMLRDDLSAVLSGTYDISRIISRISLGTVTPKDLIALKMTLLQLPELEVHFKQRQVTDAWEYA